MCYGQTTRNTRELAFEMATLNHIEIPPSWHEKKAAGIDWMQGFFKRNGTLSIRQPENCSLSRMTSFTRPNVDAFFNNLEMVLARFSNGIDSSRIFNLDETSTSTVPSKSVKIVAQKGMKTVSNAASAERGILVTTTCFVSASGNTIPPAMVFPRVKFRDHMLINAIPGTLGLASSSGWMSADLFPQVMHHFVKYTLSSRENPTILIMDNHSSHISIEAINIAKTNGVTIVTLPPHCSNKLQPLDITCFAPFKKFYASAIDTWMKTNPGKTFSIYEVAGCVRFAHQKALTPENITKGFERSGIFPFNREVFSEEDFLCNFVTDRPQEDVNNTKQPCSAAISDVNLGASTSSDQGVDSDGCRLLNSSADQGATSDYLNNNLTCVTSSNIGFISPEAIQRYPKASPRKKCLKPRKKGKSMVPTDTPEKTVIENAARETKLRATRKEICKRKLKRKIVEDEEDSKSDTDYFSDTSESEMSDDLPAEFRDNIETVDVGDFVLVEFKDKKKFYYVGKVIKVNQKEDCEVSYCRKSSKVEGAFVFPLVEDLASVTFKDIKLILPVPCNRKGTKRANSFLKFPVNFAGLDVR